MATIVRVEHDRFNKTWDRMTDYPSSTFSGSAPDQAHKNTGGFHCSADDLRAYGNQGDYSDRRWADIRPQRKDELACAATDMSMNTADMVRCWNRVYGAWLNRATDLRAKYINAVNGWNGVGSAERLDFDAGTRTTATADHKWHTHWEIHRMYINDPRAIDAMLSILRGETVAQWNAGNGGGDDDMDDLQNKKLTSAEFRLHHLFQLDPTVEGDPFGGTYDLKLVTKLLELFDDVADLKQALADLKARPAATVEMTAADHDAIAERVAARLGTLRFVDTDGPDEA